jgi:DNA-directed RNA polymerase subunit RPC12/RpoP
MRIHYMTVEFECVGCHEHVDLEVEIESQSDYYHEDSCPHCGAALPIEVSDRIPEKWQNTL